MQRKSLYHFYIYTEFEIKILNATNVKLYSLYRINDKAYEGFIDLALSAFINRPLNWFHTDKKLVRGFLYVSAIFC